MRIALYALLACLVLTPSAADAHGRRGFAFRHGGHGAGFRFGHGYGQSFSYGGAAFASPICYQSATLVVPTVPTANIVTTVATPVVATQQVTTTQAYSAQVAAPVAAVATYSAPAVSAVVTPSFGYSYGHGAAFAVRQRGFAVRHRNFVVQPQVIRHRGFFRTRR